MHNHGIMQSYRNGVGFETLRSVLYHILIVKPQIKQFQCLQVHMFENISIFKPIVTERNELIIFSWLYNNNWLFRLFHLLLIICLMHTADTGLIYGEVLLDANWIRICFLQAENFLHILIIHLMQYNQHFLKLFTHNQHERSQQEHQARACSDQVIMIIVVVVVPIEFCAGVACHMFYVDLLLFCDERLHRVDSVYVVVVSQGYMVHQQQPL